jgi:hemolysin III
MSWRVQGSGEEIANAASHGLGFVLALGALPLLVAWDAPQGGGARGAGTMVFLVTMLLLYLASALFHAMPEGPARQRLKRVDHAAIFLFIAGSWTPLALRTGAGWQLFALVWGIAFAGAGLKLADCLLQQRVASTLLYIAFGWLALATAGVLDGPAMRGALAWLVAGGVAYSVGTVFFLLDERLRYGHLVWHLFVLSGSACHFAAVLLQAS